MDDIVKIPLPYNGEKIGAWTTYASKTYDHDRNEYDYSIDVTVKGFGNIVPFNPTFNTYTTDGGWAKLRIPESYRPSGNFDNVDVKVTVTSPNINTGNILRTTGLIAPTIFLNDTIDSRSRTLFEMEKTYINQNITLIPTITDTYQMYDDGTNGDTYANNHYWTAKVPQLEQVGGNHKLHYVATITHNDVVFTRESVHTVFVEVKIDPAMTQTVLESLNSVNGRNITKYTFTPMDSFGNYLGPGKSNAFDIKTTGDAIIENMTENGSDSYIITVSWTNNDGMPTVSLEQNDKIRQTVILPDGDIIKGVPEITSNHNIPINIRDDGERCKSPFELRIFVHNAGLFCLPFESTGGHPISGALNLDDKSLDLSFHHTDNPSGGTFKITFPNDLLSISPDGNDNFLVLIDDDVGSHNHVLDGNDYTIEFDYPQFTSNVRIYGTSVIPEFGAFSILVLTLAISTMTYFSFKNKKIWHNVGY